MIGYIQQEENRYKDEYSLFIRYKGVTPNNGSYLYEQRMYETKQAHTLPIGNSQISVVEESNATQAYAQCLQENPYFFVDLENNQLIKDKTFIISDEMVAL